MRFIGNIFKVIIGIAMMVAVVLIGIFIYASVSRALSALPVPSSSNSGNSGGSTTSTGNDTVMFTVKPGETPNQIADNLQNAGVINSSFIFMLNYKTSGGNKSLKAGRFQLQKGMDPATVINTLSTSPAEIGVKFTVIEGTRLEQVAEKLSSEGIISSSTFLSMTTTAAGAAAFNDDFIAASGKPADKGLEGFLFPDTYEIKQGGGDNSEAVVKIMLQTMEQKITPQMRQSIAASGHSVYDVLTLASIVQREGVLKEELPTIASVYWNRLNKNMILNADPTIQYAVGKSPEWWPVLSLDDLKIDSPFNSYTTGGLPPNPICAPGLDAINAAISPAQTDYLYFVAKNDGSNTHAFARTYEEHQRNLVIYGNR